MSSSEDDQHNPVEAAGDDAPVETPLQRALRLKQETFEARAQPPRGGRFQREQSARIAAGKSRPWMSK